MNAVNTAIAAAVLALMGAGAIQQGAHVAYVEQCARTFTAAGSKGAMSPLCRGAASLAKWTEGEDVMRARIARAVTAEFIGLVNSDKVK